MSSYVFLGPSLALAEARTLLDARYLPPVRQGDVYELVRHGLARRIAIIDGYFNQVPAVWHKELLWALDSGVELLGAASMGALRAAELAPFGMQGVGRIFEAYRDGRFPGFPELRFEDDDEVAVVHAPAEAGLPSASLAMVNIRATLVAASEQGVIDADACERLAACAKARFYPERTLAALCADGIEAGVSRCQVTALEQWWPRGFVDLKAEDARALLELAASRAPAGGRPVEGGFQFTAAFDELARSVCGRAAPGHGADPALEELRLQPARYRQLLARVWGAMLALPQPAADSLPAVLAQRAERDTLLQQDAGACAEVLRARAQHALRELVQRLPAAVLADHLRRELHECGGYDALAGRADLKSRCLAGMPALPPPHRLHDLELLQLEEWYFGGVLGGWIPDDVAAHAAEMGFRGLEDFHRALLREHAFRQHCEQA